MSDKKQTAVEWLDSNLIHAPHSQEDFTHNYRVFEQAKAMEKEQIKDARDSYINQMLKVNDDLIIYGEAQYKEMTSEEYYNETYGK
jgi:hypothetical protein